MERRLALSRCFTRCALAPPHFSLRLIFLRTISSYRMPSANAIRRKILDAALERFCHYGYPKTTMSELAEDCRMSTGNLYRYFEGKLDIAAAIAREHSLAAVAQLRPVLDCSERSARQRLIDCLFADLRHTFHLLAHRPRMVEMVQLVLQARPSLQAEFLRRERMVFAQILRAGAKSGEFQLADAERAAHCLQLLLLKFRFPQLFTTQPLAELERELSDVLALALAGLSSPALAASNAARAQPSAQMDAMHRHGPLSAIPLKPQRERRETMPKPMRLHAAGGG